MNNKLIIAAAGSWKTTFIIDEALNKKGSVLITTFTEANEEEIKRKFIKKKWYIPKNITIQTWFSFLLQHWVRPYQWWIQDNRVNWIIPFDIKSPPYVSEKNEKYYFSDNYNIYPDRISKFVIKCNKIHSWEVINRLSKIYNSIFIDEVQDLAWYDLDIIKLLFDSKSNILLVWDPRQVTYLTHNERKYWKYKNWMIKKFIEEEYINTKKNCDIDNKSFNHSYRNNKTICDFSSKLYPDFSIPISKQTTTTEHEWIFLIRSKDAGSYIKKYQPKSLRYKNVKNWELTFWKSKWLWFDRVLIYPTKPIKDYLKDWDINKLTSIAKFYVALTRAKFSVWIVFEYEDEDIFIKWIQKWK